MRTPITHFRPLWISKNAITKLFMYPYVWESHKSYTDINLQLREKELNKCKITTTKTYLVRAPTLQITDTVKILENYILNLPCKTTFHLNTKVR